MTALSHVYPLARRQHWLLTTQQLEAAIGPSALRHAVRTGRLHRTHRGVYAVARDDLTREGRWMAAVLACGKDAVLGYRAGAALWGVLERGGTGPEVCAPGRLRGPKGVIVHETELAPSDRVQRLRIPVTSLQRTVIDTARVLDPPLLKAVIRQAVRLHGLDLMALHDRCAEPRTDVGKARVVRALAVYLPVSGTESELEDGFLELCARFRLPRPERQWRIGRFRADFAWPDARLVVETDGRAFHDTQVAFVDDRVKDRALRLAGWTVLRFTWSEVVHAPGDVAREVRAALRGIRTSAS